MFYTSLSFLQYLHCIILYFVAPYLQSKYIEATGFDSLLLFFFPGEEYVPLMPLMSRCRHFHEQTNDTEFFLVI